MWSGDPGCEHEFTTEIRAGMSGGTASAKVQIKGTDNFQAFQATQHGYCLHCNAWRGSLGLEPTPALYVEHMVEVFRAVRRVLRRDGTLWLNIGDSYCATDKWGGGKSGNSGKHTVSAGGEVPSWAVRSRKQKMAGIKPKDLLGMPWMLTFALRDDGWYVRQEITWAKRAPMPESVTDRPTSATEKVFLLTKSPRYFYDAEAVKEDAECDRIRGPADFQHVPNGGDNGGLARRPVNGSRNLRNWWLLGPEPFAEAHFACVDEDTECLTAAGWRRHGEIEVGQLAAQFDMATQTLSWGSVETVARYAVANQPMIVGARRDLSMMLTPNHRCVIQRRRAHGEPALGLMPPDIVRADRLLTSHRIPTAADWVPGGDTSITTEWAELLGWYVAEGRESKQSLAVEIYQSASANPDKVERIEALLRQVGAEWTMARARRLYRGAIHEPVAFRVTGYAAVRLRELAPGKRLPDGLLLWSQDRLQALMDGLIAGDGHIRTDERSSFIQKDTHTADIAQAIGVRLGLAATLSAHASGTWRIYFTKHRTRSFRGSAGKGQPLETTLYSGTVWCPKLPHGTWVARRNGRVFITGNTFPTEIPRRAILAGTSERGVCPRCGAPWGRVLRKTAATVYSPASEYGNGAGRNDGNRSQLVGAAAETIGWRPACACTAGDPRPATVLDCFLGAGTTGMVADQLGRNCIGIELNPEYAGMARRRIEHDAGMFAEIAAE